MLYLVVTQGRTGSSLLCSYLKNTKLMGIPAEWFNETCPTPCYMDKFPDASRRLKDALQEVFTRTHTAETGLAGIKGTPNALMPRFYAGKDNLFYPGTDKKVPIRFVHIHRRNARAQAISLALSARTGVWGLSSKWDNPNIKEGETWESIATREAEQLDLQGLAELAMNIRMQDAHIQQMLKPFDGRAITLAYEELVEDPLRCVHEVAKLVKLEDYATRITEVETPLLIQRGPWTDRVYDRMRKAGLWA